MQCDKRLAEYLWGSGCNLLEGASGGVGGGVLMAIIGMLKNTFAK